MSWIRPGWTLLGFIASLGWLVPGTPAGEIQLSPLLVITDLRPMDEQTSVTEAQAFSEFIRREVDRTGLYRVLSRASMLSILKANSFPYPCHELPCFAAMGRLLGADQVMAGYFKRQGAQIEVTLRVIDVPGALFIKTVHRYGSNLTSSELMGEWGRQLISEAFQIEKALLGEESGAGTTSPATQPDAVPDAVKNKYPGMIYIPEGWTVIGSNSGDPGEMPPHKVHVAAFYISRYEVTNQEYAEFVHATGHAPPRHWTDGAIPPGLETHPVNWVSFVDAEAYCLWKGGRLPTEEEWEYAAHGPKPRLYPWGDTFDSNRANTWESNRHDTAPVGSYPQGESPFGVEDMAGNVFEWVNSFFRAYPGAKIHLKEFDRHLRVLRGGSWNFNAYYARTTHRFARSGAEIGRSFGFRFARDADPR